MANAARPRIHVGARAAEHGDSDGWGSVTRLRLSPTGRRVLESEVITTGLHSLCAGDLTP
jgi:hypothetical protein